MVNNLNVLGFATLHGRSIPVAVGVKMANPKLTVIAQGGEGGIVTEGGNHLIHAAQRNDDITVILNNNYVFALTTGQTSAATPKGLKTRSTPEGNPFEPLSAIDLAAVAGTCALAYPHRVDNRDAGLSGFGESDRGRKTRIARADDQDPAIVGVEHPLAVLRLGGFPQERRRFHQFIPQS